MCYEETVAVTEKDRKKAVLYVILGFVLAYVLMNVYSALSLPFSGIARLCFIGIAVAGIYYAFRHCLIEYKYKIEDTTLLFITNSGKYDKVLAEVEAERVVRIKKGAVQAKNVINAAKSSGERLRYTLECTDDQSESAYIIFEPSETYLERAKELGIEVE